MFCSKMMNVQTIEIAQHVLFGLILAVAFMLGLRTGAHRKPLLN